MAVKQPATIIRSKRRINRFDGEITRTKNIGRRINDVDETLLASPHTEVSNGDIETRRGWRHNLADRTEGRGTEDHHGSARKRDGSRPSRR